MRFLRCAMPTDYKKQGKTNRRKGKDFELKARKYFEAKGWIVSKFANNIDLEKDCMKPAGIKYIPGRGMMPGLGFPDFVMFKKRGCALCYARTGIMTKENYQVLFVECKLNNILSKLEKQKLQWLVNQGHRCFVAFNNDGEIGTREFVEYKERNKVCRKKTGD